MPRAKKRPSDGRKSASKIKQAALAYAAQGWPVLACYTNTPEGCTCGDSSCYSPGKHPRPDLSPNGVNSATTDLDEIAQWPDDINIGIALGHNGLMAFDVDDAEVAAALLAPETVLHDETGCARTGRGVHVYFKCSGEAKTMHLRDKASGRKLGHIAGVGAYTIAPPSAAPAGKFYKWIGQNGRWIPNLAETTDAFKYIKHLLGPLDIEITKTKSLDIENLPDVEIAEHDLSDISKRLATSDALRGIRQRLKGNRNEGAKDIEQDTSGWEHFAACEIVRVAKKTYGIKSIDPLMLAGIIKKLDRVHYGKFESQVEKGIRTRAGADHRYYVAAIRALDTENMRQQTLSDADLTPKAKKPQPDTDLEEIDESGGRSDEPSYVWDEDVNRLFHVVYHKKGETSTRIANFNVKLLSEIMVDKGDGQPDRAWRVQFVSPFGQVKEVSLRADEFDSTSSLERALARKLSHEYIVSHNGHTHLKPAILELTDLKTIKRYSIRAVPGWWTITNADGEEERVYLLPSALGAITKSGLNPDLRMNIEELKDLDDDISRKEFEAYGKNVRPPASKEERTQAWKALRALATCAPQHITMPIILQVLMGPLWAAGADEVPSLLHVTGRTGVLKTSFCLAAMSLMGTFRKTTPPTASWPSVSPSALRSLLSAAKDLTVLVDDYKEGVVYDKRGMRELVQAYADKSLRQRLKSSGERRKSLELQAVMLSNGEDRWEREASMVARTIFLDIHDNDIQDAKLRDAQDAVDAGHVQLLGGHFLSWLAGQDALFEERGVEALHEKWHRRFLDRTQKQAMHRRILSSVGTMAAVGDVFLLFVKECYPKRHQEAKQWVKSAIQHLVSGSTARAKEVTQLAPCHQFFDEIASEVSGMSASFYPTKGITGSTTRLPDAPRAEVIGWCSGTTKKPVIHLNKQKTFGWYQKRMKSQGNEVTFSWNAVVQEATNGLGAVEERIRVGKTYQRQIRVISMPYSVLDS